MTKQFHEVIRHIYDAFRKHHLEINPGSNENDCERAFLLVCLAWVFTWCTPWTPGGSRKTIEEMRAVKDLIESIR